MPHVTFETLLQGQGSYAPKILPIEGDRPPSFTRLTKKLKTHLKNILSEIEVSRGEINKFYIGKTYARKRKNKAFEYEKMETWNSWEGVNDMWRELENKGYDGMVVLCAVTENFLPFRENENAAAGKEVRLKQDSLQDYVNALKQQLIHDFRFTKQDQRLDSHCFGIGNKDNDMSDAYVLVFGFKLKATVDDEE